MRIPFFLQTRHILDSDHALGKLDERRDKLKITERGKARREAQSSIKKAGIPSGPAIFPFLNLLGMLSSCSSVISAVERLQHMFAEVSTTGETKGDETVNGDWTNLQKH